MNSRVNGKFAAGHTINKNREPWNKGIKTPLATRKKQSLAKKGRTWAEIYGDDRSIQMKRAMSGRMKGNNFNRLGLGQGGGYTGRYKSWYFRSLLELTFIIEAEESGLEIYNSENTFAIKMDNGRIYKPDFYSPDFFGPTLIEVKPAKRICDEDVKYKSSQAARFCKENGIQFTIGFDRMLPNYRLREIYESGELVLSDKIKKRLEKRLYARL